MQGIGEKSGDSGCQERGVVAAPVALRDLWFVRRDRDCISRRLEAAQVEAVCAFLPLNNLVNVTNALLVAWVMASAVPGAELAGWFAALMVLGAARMSIAKSFLKASDRAAAARPTIARLMIVIFLSGMLWALLPLDWFDSATQDQRLVIIVAVIGMMCGATLVLSTAPPVAFAYVVTMTGAVVLLAWRDNLPVLGLVTCMFGASLLCASLWQGRHFVSQMKARLELQEQGELVTLLREFAASGSGWLWELDAQGRFTYVSKSMADELGHATGELLGVEIAAVLDPSGRIRSISAGMRSLFDHFGSALPFRDITLPIPGGRWWSLSGKPLLDEDGSCIGWRGVGSDITDVRLTGQDSVRAARQDPLTGLANRLMIREQLEEALLRHGEDASACSLLLVDLDRFKLVNDTLGHSVGDELLLKVAERLEDCAGPGASVGRVGGDEFAILWFGSHEDVDLAEFSQMVIARLSEPYRIHGSDLTIGATVGVASSPRDGRTQEELTRSADLALYRAKEAGRGGFQFYDSAMVEEARWKRQLESDLRRALQNGGLTLAYQPFVDAATGDIVGKEALLRWRHPQQGEIPPDLFVPVIEDVGLISQVGSWVIRQACEEAARWPEHLHIAVNVSAAQLTGSALANTVVGALGASGLAADRLELEITETSFLRDDAATLDALEGLRRLGVRLVLDDFGTGYSSFGYLARARFNKIKIDKSFVHAVCEGSRQASAIVESIVALAHGLSLQITAEGVESGSQAQLMRTMGCDLLQGFYFGRPAAAQAAKSAKQLSANGSRPPKRYCA